MHAYHTILPALVVGSFMAPAAAGTTITICPDGTGDYATIQEGISAAAAGDEIVLCEGVYTGPGNRDLDFEGKAITVRSTEPGNPDVVEATVIDCQGTASEPHRAFTFHSQETTSSVVSGLRLTNGFAPDEDIGYGSPMAVGGAIHCAYASPTITRCHVSNSEATWGGGIFSLYGQPAIANCTVSGNPSGGGIYCLYSDATITDCTVIDNGDGSSCGGIKCFASSPTIAACVIRGNWGHCGGGIYNDQGSHPTITNCVLTRNRANGGGGGIACDRESNPTITNCVFHHNTAGDLGGGGASFDFNCTATLTNCVFFGNEADEGSTEISTIGSHVTLTNSILWNGMPAQAPRINLGFGSTLTVAYSDVEDGPAAIYVGDGSELTWSDGNLDVDPLWAYAWSGNYRLLDGSPCIDAGDSTAVPPEAPVDIDGQDRFFDDPATPDTGRAPEGSPIVDMGAYEFAGYPTPVGLVSRKEHGPAGGLDIVLPLDGGLVTTGECRNNGPTTLIFTFSEPILAEDGVPDASEVGVSAGMVQSVGIAGNELTIGLQAVPDASCLAIHLRGLVDFDGHELLGPDARFAVLAGDTNGDGRTDLIDMAQVKSLNGAPVATDNAWFDVNLDGHIDLIDMALIKSLNGHAVACP